ncbi:type I restriction enzyme HsdR N-terminal domain-containing protein [uncultured Flavobacterium sp.]|uniref:type I restriction enzyme HsdR N-terminal domain-containing protein n=1 Tax=uncultured Flavobacterium sp. TaxID=165435 RepID=UPI0030EDCE3A|tara:strand:+ start:283484 stop:284503 length:1020 start_codon:yes stop_codon:yes gene_type:complete
MANILQIVKEIRKSLSNFDILKGMELSDNEAKTRMYLVEPFFECLRFNRGFENSNLVPEFDADFANLKGKKVDYAILFRNKPEIIVEVKKCNVKLNNKHLAQLNEYFNNTNDSKIGILTNGIQYEFYCRNNNAGFSLHPTPFYVFDWDNIDGSQLEKLAEFYATSIDTKNIIESAQETFFMEGFEEALFKELASPSRDFVKAIFSHMNGSRLTENIEKQITELINSVSLKSALDRLIIKESTNANSGVITTEDELKVFHVIKTILAQHKQIDTNSIGYKDFKGKFSIIIDDNQKKKVCDLYITHTSHKIEIDGEKIDIPDIDSIVKLKKRLIDKAISII